jgi:cytochrome c
MTRYKSILFLVLMCLMPIGSASADSSAKKDYLADCARCHGADGKGHVAAMRSVPGYKSVDLTQLSKENGGRFPRQKVYDTIEGRKRFPAHFIGDMPTWGLKYREDDEKLSPEAQAQIKRRISDLVDYIESIQEK